MFTLLKFIKPYWLLVFFLVISAVLQTWFAMQLPTLMADIVNRGIIKNDLAAIFQTSLWMVVATIISALCTISTSFFSTRIGTSFARDLRRDIFKQILSFGTTEIDDFSTASLITRTTNDVANIQSTLVMSLNILLRAPITSVVAIIQAIIIAPNLTWVLVLALALILILIVTLISILMPKFAIYQKIADRIALLTRENITGLKVIRAFNAQAHEQAKFGQVNTELTNLDLFIGKVLSIQSPIIMLIMNGTGLLCVWVGVQYLPTDMSYLGSMIAFMQYAMHAIMSFLMLAMLFVMIPRANISIERINAVLKTQPVIKWPAQTVGQPSAQASIEFKNVDFAFADAKEKVLQNISFTAQAGQTTAFIGSTGSGKSTLVNLVLRFFDITAGQILIDGLDIKNYAEADLMQKIGHVPQKGFLFSGTIRENLTFGVNRATDAEIAEVAKITQSWNFINKFPGGINTRITEGGSNVSGGQRQRLSIARALLKKPDIYIFDDSFSALDAKTDARLRAALRPFTREAVTLIVAQRINTIKDADQIIVLDKGRLIGKGTHLELLGSCQVYREIAASQFSEQEYEAEISRSQNV